MLSYRFEPSCRGCFQWEGCILYAEIGQLVILKAMKPASTLPLIREAVLEPFIVAAKDVGAPVEKLLRASGLPTGISGDATLLLLEPAAWRFIQSVAHREGIPDFGLLAATAVSYLDIPAMKPLLTGYSNLYGLLHRFSSIARLYGNNNCHHLEEKEHLIRFSHRGARYVADDIQVQQFQVLNMIQLIQQATGTKWHPDDIYFSFKSCKTIEQSEEFSPGRIHFHQPHPAIDIPRKLLASPVSMETLQNGDIVDSLHDFPGLPDSFSSGLQEIIFPYLGIKKISKFQAAEMTGLSLRTLQRRLANEQTTYSRIYANARLNKAEILLKNRDANLLDITFSLGYQNASTFSRAFHQWTGVSPREYRKQHAG